LTNQFITLPTAQGVLGWRIITAALMEPDF
jgi:hypothetical protein